MDSVQSGVQPKDCHEHFQGMEFVDLMATKAFHQPRENQCLHSLQSSQLEYIFSCKPCGPNCGEIMPIFKVISISITLRYLYFIGPLIHPAMKCLAIFVMAADPKLREVVAGLIPALGNQVKVVICNI